MAGIRLLNRPAATLGTLLAGAVAGACLTARGGSVESLLPGKAAVAAPPYSADKEPIVQAARLASPSVVAIDTTAKQSRTVFDSREDWFFGRGRRETQEVPTGSGSGVLLEGGYVLTNQHVVGDAVQTGGKITITLTDGRAFSAQPVGADRATDVALLKVQNPSRLPEAQLGENDSLQPGQTVLAIGNPVGLSHSVSAGVVSALGRPLVLEDRTYENLIQTDTAINPGNSGGALVDLAGKVVGINTLVRTDAQNIGFAIPIKTAMQIVDELKRNGKVRRPFDGIVPTELTARLTRMLRLPSETKGIVVRAVYRDSPAADAGLQQGDVLVSLAGQAISDEASYRRALAGLRIGQTVEAVVIRDNQQGTVKLRLAEAP
ncbi:S1C family serine protease [Armatimonas rosea]|uniref:S1-C subfamily serine protease n=1 Tax=Armatimonas rosea TaxID=685828 RepID=A0A7W9W4Y2_ARMRO|nr:trypsin-like peptidase domain-containing protein [Armatimonas rosea]MBB6048330.1 S1-C subfamily serine protease [Armatimonas rosea]